VAKSLAPRGTLLSMLPVDLSAGLFDHAKPVHLDPGQTLFLGGDPGDGCYLVDEGLVKVHVILPSGGDRILAVLGPGMLVGELSMLDGAARSASASAIHESKLSFVSRAAFDAIASARPEIYWSGRNRAAEPLGRVRQGRRVGPHADSPKDQPERPRGAGSRFL